MRTQLHAISFPMALPFCHGWSVIRSYGCHLLRRWKCPFPRMSWWIGLQTSSSQACDVLSVMKLDEQNVTECKAQTFLFPLPLRGRALFAGKTRPKPGPSTPIPNGGTHRARILPNALLARGFVVWILSWLIPKLFPSRRKDMEIIKSRGHHGGENHPM